MDIKDVMIPEADILRLISEGCKAFTEISELRNPMKAQEKMYGLWLNIYKQGYVKGYHVANGDKILIDIKEPE